MLHSRLVEDLASVEKWIDVMVCATCPHCGGMSQPKPTLIVSLLEEKHEGELELGVSEELKALKHEISLVSVAGLNTTA